MQAILMSVKTMKSYTKKTCINTGILLLAVLLLVVVNAQSVMSWNEEINRRLSTSGEWSYINFTGQLNQASAFDTIGTISILNEDEDIIIGSFDTEMFEMSHLKLVKGRLPGNSQEAIITSVLLEEGMEIGDTIQYTMNNSTETFELVGIIEFYATDWIEDMVGPFSFPNVITTQGQSEKIASFGKMNRIDPNFMTDDILNTLSYPELDSPDGSAYKAFLEQKRFNQKQLQSYSLALVAITGFLILFIVNENSNTYEKKTKVLRTLGYTQKDEFVYHMAQYGIYISLMLIFAMVFPLIGYLLFKSKFAMNYTIYTKSIVLIFKLFVVIAILKSLYCALTPLVPSVKIITKKTAVVTNRLRYLGIFLVIFFSFIQMTTPLIEIKEHELRILRVNAERVRDEGYLFSIQNYSEYENISLNRKKVDSLFSRDGVTYAMLYRLGSINLEDWFDPVTNENNEAIMGITVVPDEYLVDFDDIDFVEGYRMYDTYFPEILQEKTLTTRRGYTFDIEYIEELPEVFKGLGKPLVSQKGYEKGQGKTMIPNSLIIMVDKDSKDILEIEKDFLKIGTRSYKVNGYRGMLNSNKVETNRLIEHIFVVCLYFFTVMALLITITFNSLNSKRRTIGTAILLGMNYPMIKKRYIWIDQIVVMITPFISSVAGYLVYTYVSYQEYLLDAHLNIGIPIKTYKEYTELLITMTLKENTLWLIAGVALIFVIIMLLINGKLLKRFCKTNPFELIDERE